MMLLKRFVFFLIIVFSTGHLFAQRDAGDTLLVHRPRYVGFFFGRIQYAQASHSLYDAAPSAYLGNQIIKVTVGDAYHGGMFFTFPFLHKMEWDLGAGVFSFARERVWAEVTQVTPGFDPHVVAYRTWHDPTRLTVAEFRSYFSCEVEQHDDYSILIGAGGWIATQTMVGSYSPGTVGLEGNVTGYYRFHNKTFVQMHLSAGWM